MIWCAVALELSIFLASCLTLLAGNYLKIHITIIDGLGIEIPHHAQKNPKDVMIQDLCCFWELFSQIDLSLYCIISFIHTSIALPKACKQIKVDMHNSLVCGLQNSSYFPQNVSRLRSSLDKPQDTYWSMPKSPVLSNHAFLHFWHSGRAASSHS